jgi:hypothetical protein
VGHINEPKYLCKNLWVKEGEGEGEETYYRDSTVLPTCVAMVSVVIRTPNGSFSFVTSFCKLQSTKDDVRKL